MVWWDMIYIGIRTVVWYGGTRYIHGLGQFCGMVVQDIHRDYDSCVVWWDRIYIETRTILRYGGTGYT